MVVRIAVALSLLLALACAAAQPSVYIVQRGDTLYAIAHSFGMSVAELAAGNGIEDVDRIAVGQRLVIPGAIAWPEKLPEPFQAVELRPAGAVQGWVQALSLRLAPGARLVSVRYTDAEVALLPQADRSLAALLVTPVMQSPGRAALTLVAESAEGRKTLVLPVAVRAGGYRREEILLSAETSRLLEPAIVEGEHALIEATCARFAPARLWQGRFRYPLDVPVPTSAFGTLRSYNGGPYSNFHRGLDLDGEVGTPVYAAADGVVALSDTLQVRGETVVLDHGMGVCSAYNHLSERFVTEGQAVEAGTLIGRVGETGLVTGPHLHWEVRVGGIPVAPLQWVEQGVGP